MADEDPIAEAERLLLRADQECVAAAERLVAVAAEEFAAQVEDLVRAELVAWSSPSRKPTSELVVALKGDTESARARALELAKAAFSAESLWPHTRPEFARVDARDRGYYLGAWNGLLGEAGRIAHRHGLLDLDRFSHPRWKWHGPAGEPTFTRLLAAPAEALLAAIDQYQDAASRLMAGRAKLERLEKERAESAASDLWDAV